MGVSPIHKVLRLNFQSASCSISQSQPSIISCTSLVTNTSACKASPPALKFILVLPNICMLPPLAVVTSMSTGDRVAPLTYSSGTKEWSHPVSSRHWSLRPEISISIYVSGFALPHAAPFAAAGGGLVALDGAGLTPAPG